MLPALYPRLHSYRQVHTKSSSSMVRYRMQPIGLKLSLDATSKCPTIIVKKQKPQKPHVLPSTDQFTVNEGGILTSDRVGNGGCDSSSFKVFSVGHGDSTIRCSVYSNENQISLSMEHGSHLEKLHIQANRNPRQIAGNLVANYLAADKWYLWFAQLATNAGVYGLFGDAVQWSTTSGENRASLHVDYPSDIRDGVRIETDRDRRRLIGNLVANHIAAGKFYLPMVQIAADIFAKVLVKAVDPLFEIAVNVLTQKNDGDYDSPLTMRNISSKGYPQLPSVYNTDLSRSHSSS